LGVLATLARLPGQPAADRDVGLVGIHASDELDQLACLGSKVRPLRIYLLTYEIESHRLSRISDAQ
jgi:hypothetical protein